MSQLTNAMVAVHSKQYVAQQCGLELATFRLTRDKAWITFARKLKKRLAA